MSIPNHAMYARTSTAYGKFYSHGPATMANSIGITEHTKPTLIVDNSQAIEALVQDTLGGVKGGVWLPGSDGYAKAVAEARSCNNCSAEVPALVIQPEDADDVSAAVLATLGELAAVGGRDLLPYQRVHILPAVLAKLTRAPTSSPATTTSTPPFTSRPARGAPRSRGCSCVWRGPITKILQMCTM